MIGFTIIGVPLGLLVLRTAPDAIVRAMLGVVVAGCAAFSLYFARPM